MHTSYDWYWPSLTRSSFFLVLNKIVIGGWIQLSLLNNSNVKIPNKGTRSSEMCLTYGLICPVAWNVEFTKSINVHCLTFLIYIREPTRFFLYTHIIRVINKAEVNPTDKLIQKGVNCFLIKTEVFLPQSDVTPAFHLYYSNAIPFKIDAHDKPTLPDLFWLVSKLNNLHNSMLIIPVPFSFLI